MEILCLNPAVSMRAYRQMKALSETGSEVYLHCIGYGGSVKGLDYGFLAENKKILMRKTPLSHFPQTLMPSAYKSKIRDIISDRDFDIILVHSMPDILGVAANRYASIPVVFDERDMVTAFVRDHVLRNYIPDRYLKYRFVHSAANRTIYSKLQKLEREANLRSDMRLYVSDYTYELARRKYNIPEENSMVFPNYAMRSDIHEQKDKISEKEGGVHIVYEGVLSFDGYRAPLLELFKKIAEMGIHIHIYGIGDPDVLRRYLELQKRSAYYHFHEGLEHDLLMGELTRYDFGLIPFFPPGKEREHFDTMLPNKIFDYLAAGIPVIVPDSISMARFVRKFGCGIILGDLDELRSRLEGSKIRIRREDFIIETHIEELLSSFRRVIR
ncbi:MAG: glycosyltransferase [Thermoplasmatota archaeon]